MANIALAFATASVLSSPPIPMSKAPDIQVATVCFKSGEQQGGMNKICYYNCLGSTVAITIGATQLCPLTIDN